MILSNGSHVITPMFRCIITILIGVLFLYSIIVIFILFQILHVHMSEVAVFLRGGGVIRLYSLFNMLNLLS
jgi:hypothetical protein